jgi:hypothetical protein
MQRVRPIKMWLALRHPKRRKSKAPTTETTAGSGRIPIEILQHIFSHLDILTLLLQCRLVCHLWSQCIPGNSPALRTALFVPSLYKNTSKSLVKITKLVISRLSVELSANKINPASRTAQVTGYTIRLAAIEVDRLLNKHELSIELHPLLLNDIAHSRLDRCQKSYNVNRKARPAWTSMFITNPPIS